MVYKKFKKLVKQRIREAPTAFKNVYNIASKALSTARVVAGIINSEKKYHDMYAVGTSWDKTTPIIRQITDIDQGDAETQRNGNSISLKSMLFRASFGWHATAPGEGGTEGFAAVRCLIIRDNTPNAKGVTPLISEILERSTTIEDLMMSPMNMENNKRFKVLYENCFHEEADRKTFRIEMYKKFMMRENREGLQVVPTTVTWSGPDGEDDAEHGHLWLIFLTTANTVDARPSVAYTTRIRYYDN